MSDGCICCTLREDLMREVASPPEGRFDAPLINSTGASTPCPIPFRPGAHGHLAPFSRGAIDGEMYTSAPFAGPIPPASPGAPAWA
jgi:hypothetical protein